MQVASSTSFMACKQGPPRTFICKLQVREINVFPLHKNTKVGVGVAQSAECLSRI